MPVLPRHIDAFVASTAVSHALRCRMLPIALEVNVKPHVGQFAVRSTITS